jgi:hypothetical protein
MILPRSARGQPYGTIAIGTGDRLDKSMASHRSRMEIVVTSSFEGSTRDSHVLDRRRTTPRQTTGNCWMGDSHVLDGRRTTARRRLSTARLSHAMPMTVACRALDR